MSILAQQLSSIAKVLDTSFKLYAASFKKTIVFGLIIAVGYVALGLFTAEIIPIEDTMPESSELILMEYLPVIGVSIIFSILFSFIIYAAIVYRIDNAANEREDSFGAALAVGVKKLPSMIWAIILFTIAVSIGMILLVIPGIILMLSLAFYPFFIVLENSSGFSSLSESHRLVWGNWWRTMAVFFVPGFLLMIFIFIFGLIAAWMVLDNSNSMLPDMVMNMASAFYMPYFYVLGYVQYHDLKLRTSGSDLEARIAE